MADVDLITQLRSYVQKPERTYADESWLAEQLPALIAALELEVRIRHKNFELTGVHEALRKETARVERLEKALKEIADGQSISLARVIAARALEEE